MSPTSSSVRNSMKHSASEGNGKGLCNPDWDSSKQAAGPGNGWQPSSYHRPPVHYPLSVCLRQHQHLQRDLGLRQGTRGHQIQGSQWLEGWEAAPHCHCQNLIPDFVRIVQNLSAFVSCLLLKDIANATA